MVTRRNPPASRQPATKTASSGYRGAEGLRRMKEEEQNMAARREAAKLNSDMPFRFRCPVGDTREVVIVDYDIQEVFFRHEHCMKDRRSDKWTVFCACIKENANCPACLEAERPSYFAMFLTVIDLTPYESEKHGTIQWSKKLLVVKTAQQKKIVRLAERNGPLRGMILAMTRDSDKDASIGNDIEYVEHMTEEDMATYETSYEYEDSHGQKKVKDIIGHEPFNYDQLFPMPTEQQIRAIVGGRPEAGSRAEEASAGIRRGARRTQGDDWTGDDQAPPTRRLRPAAARQRGESMDDTSQGDAPQDDVQRDPPPARTRTAAAQPARAVRRAAESEPEVEPEVYEEAPPPRRTAPPQRPVATQRAAIARPARSAQPDPEEVADDDPPEDRARPSAASLADRRRNLRR